MILASASPARLRTLRAAGLEPEVIVSGVDEEGVRAATVPDLVARLARLKAEAVTGRRSSRPTLIIGCDSLLELDGTGHGKPSAERRPSALAADERAGGGAAHRTPRDPRSR